MKVSTIVIPKETALEKLAEFHNISKVARRAEDVDFRRLYKMAAEYPILDVSLAFRETGLNEKGQPRLAMARADWKECHYHRYDRRFSNSVRYYKANSFRIPNNAWDWDKAGARKFVFSRSFCSSNYPQQRRTASQLDFV